MGNIWIFGKTEGTEKQKYLRKCSSVCLAKFICFSMSCHCHTHRHQQTSLLSLTVDTFAMIVLHFGYCFCYSYLHHYWCRQYCQLSTPLVVNKRVLLTSHIPGCGWDAWLMVSNASNNKKGQIFYGTAPHNVNTRLMKGIKKGPFLFYIPYTDILCVAYVYVCGLKVIAQLADDTFIAKFVKNFLQFAKIFFILVCV